MNYYSYQILYAQINLKMEAYSFPGGELSLLNVNEFIPLVIGTFNDVLK